MIRFACLLALLLVPALPVAAQETVAPGGVLRVAFLRTNPAQARLDPATGEYRGVAIDLARALADRNKATLVLQPLENPPRVIDAVSRGEADIGFVAPNAEREGPVAFTRTYMLVQQTFMVRADSPIASIADIDRPGNRIGAGRTDSIGFYLKQNLKQAQLVESDDSTLAEAREHLATGRIAAFGANRQRLTQAARGVPDVRLLPDDLYGVPQAIIVANGKPATLQMLDAFLAEAKRSGTLQASITRSGVIGLSVAD